MNTDELGRIRSAMTRDDCWQSLVPSDIRQLVAEIDRLNETLDWTLGVCDWLTEQHVEAMAETERVKVENSELRAGSEARGRYVRRLETELDAALSDDDRALRAENAALRALLAEASDDICEHLDGMPARGDLLTRIVAALGKETT